MGVHLYFRSRHPVEADLVDALEAELHRGWEGSPWILCEPPHLYPQEPDGRLIGAAKLNLHPDPEELAEAGPSSADDHDLRQLTRVLCQLSSAFCITWDLDIDG